MTTHHHPELGKLPTEADARDAVHFPIIPLVAAVNLSPATRVALAPDGRVAPGPNPIGIVDPFLTSPVRAGQRVWVMIFANTITDLQHTWSHPAWTTQPVPVPVCLPEERQPSVPPIPRSRKRKEGPTPEEIKLAAAKATIEHEAREAGIDYEEMMEGVETFLDHGEYLSQGGRWEGHRLTDSDAFWDAYATIKGMEIPEEKRHSFFSCSC